MRKLIAQPDQDGEGNGWTQGHQLAEVRQLGAHVSPFLAVLIWLCMLANMHE